MDRDKLVNRLGSGGCPGCSPRVGRMAVAQNATVISKGKAYFTNTMTLGQYILMDFLKKKTSTVS